MWFSQVWFRIMRLTVQIGENTRAIQAGSMRSSGQRLGRKVFQCFRESFQYGAELWCIRNLWMVLQVCDSPRRPLG